MCYFRGRLIIGGKFISLPNWDGLITGWHFASQIFSSKYIQKNISSAPR